MADWMDKLKEALVSSIEPQNYGNLSAEEIAEIEEEIITVEDDVDLVRGEYNFYVWLDEAAEPILGSERFKSLIDGFKMIPGVEKLLHEDREVIYIKSSAHTAEKLDKDMRKVWKIVRGK